LGEWTLGKKGGYRRGKGGGGNEPTNTGKKERCKRNKDGRNELRNGGDRSNKKKKDGALRNEGKTKFKVEDPETKKKRRSKNSGGYNGVRGSRGTRGSV